jgi:hypothetical protein
MPSCALRHPPPSRSSRLLGVANPSLAKSTLTILQTSASD